MPKEVRSVGPMPGIPDTWERVWERKWIAVGGEKMESFVERTQNRVLAALEFRRLCDGFESHGLYSPEATWEKWIGNMAPGCFYRTAHSGIHFDERAAISREEQYITENARA